MILRMALILLALLPSIASAMTVEMFQNMIGKINAKDFNAVERFLGENRNIYSKDPEFYVILLNYSFCKGIQSDIVITKGEPKEGDLEVRDKTSGEVVGFVGNREIRNDELIVSVPRPFRAIYQGVTCC